MSLGGHRAEFATLVEAARRHLVRGRLDAAAAYAQMAAHCAWMNHTGLFSSPELEELVGELSERIAAPARARARESDPREVLHVVTQCYGTGGSTQAIACWVEQDAGRHHRVCITRQGTTPPPEKILAPLASRSDLLRLDAERGGLMRRATRLRALASEADVVVLHLHPYDVVPAIAFARAGESPPVIYVDHTDHVFWLGAVAANVVMHMRDSGRLLAAARRGLDPERSIVVPRPLRPVGRTTGRDDAKRQLGVDTGQVLLVTAADGSKYRPVGSDDFLELVIPILQRHENALLLAAGPRPEGSWLDAERRSGGRIRALGPLPSVRLLQEAADVYVDSFPFSSLTSLLEAGSLEVPAITYRGHPTECAVFGADTRGVDEQLLTASDAAGFERALSGLIADPERRRRLGEDTGRAIRETHTGAGWTAAVDELYALAARTARPRCVAPFEGSPGRLDMLVDLVMTQTGWAEGLAGAMREHLGLLPLRERVAAWRRLSRAGERLPPRKAIPEWLLPRASRAKQLARQLGAQRTHA
jgi:glycosyltransferase involved in cell wall biosynthesis